MNPIKIYDVSTTNAISPSNACESFGYFLSEVWTNPAKVSGCVDEDGLSDTPCVTSKYCPERAGTWGVDLSNLTFMGQAVSPTISGMKQTAPFLISGGNGQVIFTNTTWLTPYGIGQSYLTLQRPNLKYSTFTNSSFGSNLVVEGGDLTFTHWRNNKVIDNQPGMFPPYIAPGGPIGAVILSNTDVQGLYVDGFQLLPQSETSLPSAITLFNTTGNTQFTGTFSNTYLSLIGVNGNLMISQANFNSGTLSISNNYNSATYTCTKTSINGITLDDGQMPGIYIDTGCGTTTIGAINIQNVETQDVNINPTSLGGFSAFDSSLNCSIPLSSDSQASGSIAVSSNAEVNLARVVAQNCFFNAHGQYVSTTMPSSVSVSSSSIIGWGSMAAFEGFNSSYISFSQVKAYSPYSSLPLVAIRNVAPRTIYINNVDLLNGVAENVVVQQPQFSSIENLTTENVLAINTPWCLNATAAPNGTTVICTDQGAAPSTSGPIAIQDLDDGEILTPIEPSALTNSSSSFFTGRALQSLPAVGTALVSGLLGNDDLGQTDASAISNAPVTYSLPLLLALATSAALLAAYLLYCISKAATPKTTATATPGVDLEKGAAPVQPISKAVGQQLRTPNGP